MRGGGPSGSGEAPIIIEDVEIDLDVEPAGIVNKHEAQLHKWLLEDALCNFK